MCSLRIPVSTLFLLACSPQGHGQRQVAAPPSHVAPLSGAINGTVSDPSGAKIARASIHIRGQSLQRDLNTDAVGRFSCNLPTGTYQLSVSSPGFETLVLEDVTVGPRPSPPLMVKLRIATEHIVLTVENLDTTAADDNGTSLVFRKEQLDALSNDDTAMQQQLLAMAGGDVGHAPQVYVDGFSGDRFPPKSSIQEVRINQNPYSAQYEGLGYGRIEIFTKPGTNKLHGFFQSQGNDIAFNARNPFTGAQPPYHTLYFDGNVSGPLGKKSSFFTAGTYNDQQNNAIVNAVALDANFQPSAISQAVPNPQTFHTYSARLDRQLTANNTFTARYEYNQNAFTNGGVGLLVLPSEGYNSGVTSQTLQLGNTQILGQHIINETRFQYIRTRLQQNAVSSDPTLIVEGSFSGGGAPSQSLRDNQDRYEFQQYVCIAHGKHFFRVGGRYRLLRDANFSSANYNGQYVYPDLATYQASLQGIVQGAQYSVTTGQPSAAILTGDIGIYADDDWKITKNLTLNLGMRYESQSAIPDHRDPAPRLGFAWAVHQEDKRPAWFTLRGGTGVFYDRFDSSAILQSVRENGTAQHTLFVPAGLPLSSLMGQPSTIYRIDPNLRSSYTIVSGLSIERSLNKAGNLSLSYLNFRGIHQFLSINANAPLPGTYNPAVPWSGVHPFGGTQNLYQYSSSGASRVNLLFLNYSVQPAKWLSLWGSYVNQHINTDANGLSSFASNSYNVDADYGPGPNEANNRLLAGGTLTLPRGLSLESFLIAEGGRPFNITTGADNNGDSIYNDRPAFATDLTRASVLRTAYGNFDTNPLPSQIIIPSNFGRGPSYVSLQLTAGKSFKVGPRPRAVPSAAPAKAGLSSTSGARPDPAYELGFSVEGRNVFNHVNGALPIGVLTSPFFGRSISLENAFFQNTAANRTVTLRAYFRF